MRINYLHSMTGAGTEAQTVMVNDIPEVNKVSKDLKHVHMQFCCFHDCYSCLLLGSALECILS